MVEIPLQFELHLHEAQGGLVQIERRVVGNEKVVSERRVVVDDREAEQIRLDRQKLHDDAEDAAFLSRLKQGQVLENGRFLA